MDIKITEDVQAINQQSKKVIGTQIPQSLYMRLKHDADTDFMSISDLLRKIIFNYYKNQQNGND